MREYFNMVCGFISYGQKFLCFFYRTTVFLVLARIDVSVGQDAFFKLASMHVQLDSQCVQLARIDVSVGQDAYISWPACMFSWLEPCLVGQKICLSWLAEHIQGGLACHAC